MKKKLMEVMGEGTGSRRSVCDITKPNKWFITINHDDYGKHNCINHNLPANSACIKFLDLNVDDKLSWKSHIDYLVTSLSSLCFVMRTIKELENDLLCLYALHHDIRNYFWG
jgi:hypothetical protein